MIALLSLICITGVFWAGSLFGVHTVAGIALLGFFVTCLGVIIAAAETRGFEGSRISGPRVTPWTWDALYFGAEKLMEERGVRFSGEPLYIQTVEGPQPLTGVYLARINHKLSLVFDTTMEPVYKDEY